jgi:hypothetical protein
MAAQFDGETRLITLDAPTAGVLNQTAEQVYDEAKQWYLGGENSRYPFPFLTSGGEPVTDTTIAGQYYFLDNNVWQIWSTDESQDVFWEGNLIPVNLTKRMIATRPGRTVAHFGLQPLVTGLTGLGAEIALDVMSYIIETGYTFEEVMRILVAHAAGSVPEVVDGTYQIRDINDTKDRIEGTETANGGRSITAVDAT